MLTTTTMMMADRLMGPLAGIKIIEFAGIGPWPMAR